MLIQFKVRSKEESARKLLLFHRKNLLPRAKVILRISLLSIHRMIRFSRRRTGLALNKQILPCFQVKATILSHRTHLTLVLTRATHSISPPIYRNASINNSKRSLSSVYKASCPKPRIIQTFQVMEPCQDSQFLISSKW